VRQKRESNMLKKRESNTPQKRVGDVLQRIKQRAKKNRE